jgi:hypothetical protein
MKPKDHLHDYSAEPRLRDTAVYQLASLSSSPHPRLANDHLPDCLRTPAAFTLLFALWYQAVYKHGAIKGSFMAAWRVLRAIL